MDVVALGQFSHYVELLLRAHILVIFVWLVLGFIYPPIAEAIAQLFAPLANLIAAIYPKVNDLWHGTLSPNFYRSITGEVFFISFLVTVLSAYAYLAKSWSQPCLLIEAIAAHTKQQKVHSLGMAMLLIILLGLAFILARLLIPIWFGIIQPEPWKPIKLHQLGLWAIYTSISGVMAVWLFFVLTSYVAYISRSCYRFVVGNSIKTHDSR